VSKLVELHPAAAKEVNKDGQLPLHTALLAHRVDPGVIRALLAAHPEGSRAADAQGATPLLLCAQRTAADSEDNTATALACSLLCEACPEAAKMVDNALCLPLHHAARWPNVGVLSALLLSHPVAAAQRNSLGLLPLHILCGASNDLTAARVLFAANPAAVRESDRQGRSCLHIA
ncbi:hypothetical protein B484DRAFT_316326, partial [Ochromonadaceae sp. CCMP2298]